MRWFSSAAPAAKSAAPARDESALFDEAFQRQLESLALAARKLVQGRDRAERRTRRAGHGIELADYRSYSPGDDYRHIDWNAYARTERLLLRLFEQEEDLGVSLLLDCSASMGATAASGSLTKLARGKQLVAALAYIALSGLDRVSIHALGVDESARMPAARGKAQIFTALEFLRRLSPEGPTDLASAVARFIARQKRRGLVVLVSDLYDPKGVEHAISALRYARFEVHVIRVLDEAEAEAEPALRGDVELVDSETGATRTVTITPALLARYRAAFEAQRARIEGFCREKHVPLHTVTTREALDTATLRVLRRGGLLES